MQSQLSWSGLLWKPLPTAARASRDWYPRVNDKTSPALYCLLVVLPSCWRWFTTVTTHRRGKRLPHRSAVSAGPICHRRSARVPHSFQGTSGVGRPPPCGATWWLQFMLTVTKLPRDWICVRASSRFEQISAVIFVCPCGVTADGFHSFSSYHMRPDGMWRRSLFSWHDWIWWPLYTASLSDSHPQFETRGEKKNNNNNKKKTRHAAVRNENV